MTNKELQELLKQYPDDLPVYRRHSTEISLRLESISKGDIEFKKKYIKGESNWVIWPDCIAI